MDIGLINILPATRYEPTLAGINDTVHRDVSGNDQLSHARASVSAACFSKKDSDLPAN
jgi:hypothetical protein